MILALSLGAAPAFGFQAEVGGLAGRCSTEARLGRHDDAAIDLCTRALAAESLTERDRAGTYVNRGAMHLLNKENAQAHDDFAQAVRIDPQLGEAHVGEGGYLISQQRYREAEAEISRGLDLATEQPEKAYYFRGIARWGQDDYKGAYLDFKHAVALKPDWADPKEQLAYFTVTPVR
ncbi:MAG: hypothetical protein WDM92_01760 [Caulobacteraceae bacterium]